MYSTTDLDTVFEGALHLETELQQKARLEAELKIEMSDYILDEFKTAYPYIHFERTDAIRDEAIELVDRGLKDSTVLDFLKDYILSQDLADHVQL